MCCSYIFFWSPAVFKTRSQGSAGVEVFSARGVVARAGGLIFARARVIPSPTDGDTKKKSLLLEERLNVGLEVLGLEAR